VLQRSAIRHRENLKTLMLKVDLAAGHVNDLVAFLKHPKVLEPYLSGLQPAPDVPDFNVTIRGA